MRDAIGRAFSVPGRRIAILVLLLIGLSLLFLTFDNRSAWDFILPLRGKRLCLLLLVAYSVGVSTLLFQTLTNNNVLTPGILGFDALYMFLQTVLLFLLGPVGYAGADPYSRFFIENAVMIAASILLFRVLTLHGSRDLTRMILIGVLFATLFRSFNTLMQRVLDPTVFVVLQSKQYAQFTSVRPELLLIGAGAAFLSSVWIWKKRHELDVLMLGRDHAVALGVDYRRLTFGILTVIAVLVATATTLSGPVSFFGLLICAIANAVSPSVRHGTRIPVTVLTASVMLVGGQFVFERLLGMRSVLSVVVELCGGCVFLWLILRRKSLG